MILGAQLVVVDTEASREATAEILATHCIPADRSADLIRGEAEGSPSAAAAGTAAQQEAA